MIDGVKEKKEDNNDWKIVLYMKKGFEERGKEEEWLLFLIG